ncbi:DUF1097 family protein [Arthrobacter rhombi]|uniref:DUF1097 family protein n=1 Tax=Arthrobacter rhombi TaxID=71253 RepID=UPI003FD4EE3F
MNINANVPREHNPVTIAKNSHPRQALPPEVAATVLAISAVLLGAFLGLPIYGIFLGWAAAGLAASNKTIRMPILGSCLVIGATFGAATLTAQFALEQILGPSIPQWVCTVTALAIANPMMILLGRTPAFSSVPAMFIGFSTLFAVHLGSTAPITDNLIGALLVSVFMNLTGLGVHWAFGRLTGTATPRT